MSMYHISSISSCPQIFRILV